MRINWLKLQTKILYPFVAKSYYYGALIKNNLKTGQDNELFSKMFKNNSNEKTLILENIGKVYDNGYRAVDKFNLKVNPKEFVALLGPSGCGKTTALRMISGLEYISEGYLKLDNTILNSAKPKDRELAMVFQNYALYPYMNVYDNIAFGLKIRTYDNFLSTLIFENYVKTLDSTYYDRVYLKNKIDELKHPMRSQVSSARGNFLKAKKAKKIYSDNVFNDLKSQYISLKKDERKMAMDNNGNILNLKNEIKKLKNKSKQDLKSLKASDKSEKNAYKKNEDNYSLISKLKSEIVNVKTNYKSNLNKIKLEHKDIISNHKEKKASGKEEKIESKQKLYKLLLKNEREIDDLWNEHTSSLNAINSRIFSLKHNSNSSNNRISELKKRYIESVVVWKKTIPFRVEKLTKLVGIENYLKRKPAALSGGQRQRVALVRAISRDAGLFLFDEPLSNLDAKLRGEMRREIRKIHDSVESKTIFVTHDQVEAMSMADKIVLMNKGYVQQVGTPDELFNFPASVFVADFVGSPRINLIETSITSKLKINLFGKKIPYIPKNSDVSKKISEHKNKEVIIGIRPHDVIFDTNIIEEYKRLKSPLLMKGVVVSVENIGSEKIIGIKVKGYKKDFIVISNKYTISSLGKEIEFAINNNRIHIFDSKDGVSLSSVFNEDTSKAIEIWKNSSMERIKNKILIDGEKNNKKLSHEIIKSTYGIVNRKYGNKLKMEKSARKSKKYVDETLKDVN